MQPFDSFWIAHVWCGDHVEGPCCVLVQVRERAIKAEYDGTSVLPLVTEWPIMEKR
jgi:hypothetical protein